MLFEVGIIGSQSVHVCCLLPRNRKVVRVKIADKLIGTLFPLPNLILRILSEVSLVNGEPLRPTTRLVDITIRTCDSILHMLLVIFRFLKVLNLFKLLFGALNLTSHGILFFALLLVLATDLRMSLALLVI